MATLYKSGLDYKFKSNVLMKKFFKTLEQAIEFGMSMYGVYTAYMAVLTATNPGLFGLFCLAYAIYEAGKQIEKLDNMLS